MCSANLLNLNNIKTLLMSRDNQIQLNAVQGIIELLESNRGQTLYKVTEALIAADIVEILCETMSTMNTVLTEQILFCLGLFMRCPKFFEHHHMTYVMTSLLRTLQVLLSSSEKAITLYNALKFFSKVVSRLTDKEINLSSTSDIQQVFQLIVQTTEESEYIEVAMICAELMTNILLNLDEFNPHKHLKLAITSITSKLLNLDINEEILIFVAEIIYRSLRLIQKTKGTHIIQNKDDPFFHQIQEILFKVLVPYISSINLAKIEANVLTVLLRCILNFFRTIDFPNLTKISHYLASNDFFSLLTMLESLSRDPELSIVSRTLLCELVINLSEDQLGPNNWRGILVKGFSVLPLGMSSWGPVSPEIDLETQISVIIYYYFYFLSCNRPKINDVLLHSLCYFMKIVNDEPINPFIKAFWFIFTVTYLSCNKNLLNSRPLIKVLTTLIKSDSIRSVYTHHPAILYWSFSDTTIHHHIQVTVVSLWLENDDKISIQILTTLAVANIRVGLVLLEILQNSKKTILDRALNILHSVLNKCDSTELNQMSEIAWALLPDMLTKYNPSLPPSINIIDNIICLMDFCTCYVPESPDHTLLIRIICLLPGALSKNLDHGSTPEKSNKFYTIGFCFTNILLRLSVSSNDTRGLVAILNHWQFLTLVQNCLSITDEGVSIAVLQLVSRVVRYQFRYSLESLSTTELSMDNLIHLLNRSFHVMRNVLTLLITVVEAMDSPKLTFIVSIKTPTEPELRSLYTCIHMLYFKCPDEITVFCWRCIHRLLLFSSRLELQYHLATLPFTQELILLCKTDTIAWSEMIEFLPTWINALSSSKSKLLIPPSAQKTIIQIVDSILNDDNISTNPKLHAVITKVIQIGIVPAHIRSMLRAKISIT